MIIPFKVGKNSNGEDQFIDLSETPLLMVSYGDESTLNTLFQNICTIDYLDKSSNYLATNSRRLQQWGEINSNDFIYLRDEPEQGKISSRKNLLKKVTDEISRRQVLIKRVKDFKRYHSLNLWNEEKLTYQFLLIDDIWDMLAAKPKDIGIQLIRVLLYGPAVGIHTIFASGISYRNLLAQLVNVNPLITDLLQEKYGIPEPTPISEFGRELIYSPDGLIFYKKNGFKEIEKFYP